MILLDPYANAFLRHESDPPLSWATNDKTEHHAGWVSASGRWIRCVIRSVWRMGIGNKPGIRSPSMRSGRKRLVDCENFRAQQRKQGLGPYSFERTSAAPTDTCALDGFGNPARPWA